MLEPVRQFDRDNPHEFWNYPIIEPFWEITAKQKNKQTKKTKMVVCGSHVSHVKGGCLPLRSKADSKLGNHHMWLADR